MEYGLVGEKLGHSFSKEIHDSFGRYSYELYPLPPEAVGPFLEKKEFRGINVTIPYKTVAMDYCDEIDEKAKAIGSVNTIVNRDGRLYGYNTDYFGFAYLLDTHGISLRGKSVLILGNGGTTRTVQTVAADRKAARIQVASRTPSEQTISYEEAGQDRGIQVIVNASPVGMYPNNGQVLVDVTAFPRLEAVVDVVYNPLSTELLLQARGRGIKAVNGLEMLVAQAQQAATLFTGEKLGVEQIEAVHRQLISRFSNVSLIGMPGSGKSSLGRVLAEKLHKRFVDIDEEIQKEAGKSIPEIFAEEGEEAFRAWEHKAIASAAQQTGQVISTGGGAVLNAENVHSLRQNGILIWIDCPVEKLALSQDRPLAKDREDLTRLAEEREEIYRRAADAKITYHSSFQENVDRLRKIYNKMF